MRTTIDDLEQLHSEGYDVVMGARKAPGTTGVYVALEHVGLDEPKEFYALTLVDALRQACLWSSTANRQD